MLYDRDARITPACAGKSGFNTYSDFVTRDHPRLRGEKCTTELNSRQSTGSPPLARGKVIFKDAGGKELRITPACAGKSPARSAAPLLFGDHPRLRGEKAGGGGRRRALAGSPPLARGKAADLRNLQKELGITPACAGKRKREDPSKAGKEDHPRLRGEKRRECNANGAARGSPPLARGKDHVAVYIGDGKRITPACAGKRNSSEGEITVT